MKIANPFLIRKEFKPQKHFFGENETKSINKILSSGKNVYIISNNVIEKTELIENIFHQLGKQKTITIYYNLRNTSYLKPFLLHLAVKLNINNYSNYTSDELLVKIVEILLNLKKKCVIAIDNIQFAEEELINSLYKVILEGVLSNEKINFIFAGLEKPKIGKYFQEIHFNSQIELQKFILKTFNKAKIKINKKNVERIIEWAESDYYTIKLICSRLWTLNRQKITKNDIDFVLSNLLFEYEKTFLLIKNILSDYQWKLFVAIALNKNPIQITSANFINKFNLNAPSSVKTAITALRAKGLITQNNKNYKLTNVILSRWLNSIAQLN